MKATVIIVSMLFGMNVCAVASDIIVRGQVLDVSGKPVSDVMVTDGFSITHTDMYGAYEIRPDKFSDYVYYTLPSGYDHAEYDGCIPVFYHEIDKTVACQKINFRIRPLESDLTEHRLIVFADPQVAGKDEFPLLDKVVEDMRQTVQDCDIPAIALCVGDNVFDRHELIGEYKKSISSAGIPVYHAIGNHDLDYNGRSDYRSDSTFCSRFGPSHYSFNIGRVHYVILNDVFYYGDRFLYIGYLDEAQLGWLEQDLAGVQKWSTVILAMHIPAVYGDSAEGQTVDVMRNSLQNRDALFRILDGYQVHIMAGHSHIQWNTVISDNIMEHVHVAASGAWWQGSLGRDGTPAGYTVYRMCGDDISWYYKGAGMETDEQFRLYLDSDTVAANVFNYDPDWKVEVCEDGIPAGEMEQYWGADPEAMRLYPAGGNKAYPWLSYGQTNHLFRWKARTGAGALSVRVTDRFGNVYEKRLRMPQ